MSPSDDPITRRFIEEAGATTQAIGVGRVVGQIYAYLYFSEEPRTLDDMKEALGISKGSASMGVRQLEQWGAVQRVWVKGDRKDYYTANDYFGSIIRNIMTDVMGKRLAAMSKALSAADLELSRNKIAAAERASHLGENESSTLGATVLSSKNLDFLQGRVKRLQEFQEKVNKAWSNPIVRMLLK
jgi:DNA-binding transcriptional regulator GbsR (MarR family)